MAVVALFLGACGLIGGGSDTPIAGVVPTRAPSVQQTPVVAATPELPPTPTPVPEPVFSSAEAENLVFGRIRSCADQVSVARGPSVEAVMDSVFDPGANQWQVTVSSRDKTLSFGTWRVDDTSGEVTPGNAIATSISLPSIICGEPVTQLSGAPTAPVILLPTPTPPVEPEALVQTPTQAALLVWVSVYNCYDHFPVLESFTANQDLSSNWVVEGKSETTQYGLWRVNANTGEAVALDLLARYAATNCTQRNAGTTVQTIPPTSAALRVWSAVYDCFKNPSPEFSSFTVRLESSELALVEGRAETTIEVTVTRIVDGATEEFIDERTVIFYYGLWLVDANGFAITPWDAVARATAAKSCFQEPFG